MPKDANSNGDIFGGWLMSLMDMGGGLVAARHAKGRVATVAVTGMQFLAPVHIGDEVSVFGEIIRAGHTSMTIAIEAWRRDRDGEVTSRVTEAQFTFVAIDDHGRPRPLAEQGTDGV